MTDAHGLSEQKIDTATFASSNLASGTWNAQTGEMVIVFSRTGASYSWPNVSESAWESLKAAHSPGGWLHANLGPGEPV